MEERGVNVDHVALNRWVIRYAPAIAAKAQSQKRNTNRSWRMDETYIKLKNYLRIYSGMRQNRIALPEDKAFFAFHNTCDTTRRVSFGNIGWWHKQYYTI
jgi:hypothetical protein